MSTPSTSAPDSAPQNRPQQEAAGETSLNEPFAVKSELVNRSAVSLSATVRYASIGNPESMTDLKVPDFLEKIQKMVASGQEGRVWATASYERGHKEKHFSNTRFELRFGPSTDWPAFNLELSERMATAISTTTSSQSLRFDAALN